MRTYETIYIVNPEATGDDYAAVVNKFKDVLTEQGANIIKVDEWGVRKMAYPIQKQTRGSYVLTVFEAQPEVIKEFERRMRIDEKIMKFQTVFLPKGFEATAPAETEEPAAAEETTEAE